MVKRIAIWGTGNEATKLMELLSEINSLTEKIIGEKICDVTCFFDSNIEKTLQPFYGRPVRPAKDAWSDMEYIIVVAVVKNADILSTLEQHGYSRLKGYMTLDDFYHCFWKETNLPWSLFGVLGLNDNDFLISMQSKILPNDMTTRFVRLYQDLEAICEQQGRADWLMALQNMMLLSILWSDCDWPDKQFMGKQLLDMVGIAKFITCLENVFKEDLATAIEWMPVVHKRNMEDKVPRTIAMYYMRYYNGGIERVLSKLLLLLHMRGYHLVLFTDEIREELEYPLPEGVKRVLLGHDGGRQGRCERLLNALRNYHVDIFCSHARNSNALYDLLCVQRAGVPVVLELHNNFSFLEHMPNENIMSVGLRVDALVTLSRVDEMFWHLLGCRSVYVPNPVEPAEKQESEPAPYTILCLQRIDQIQKQVFDLPAILDCVVQALPKARLQIVGRADNPEIEAHLRRLFEERGLLENVDFLGFHTDVGEYYRTATVMLITSRFEGFPMTVAESKRYGVPLVMYELPYLELLRDGRGFIAVPQNDQRGAADALVRVLSDRALRSRLSDEAKASLEAFAKNDLMQDWEKVFEMAMSEKKAPILSEKEKTFSEIERLLMQLAKRIKMEHVV